MTDEPRAVPQNVHEQSNGETNNEFNPPKFYHVRVVRLGFVQLVLGILTLCVGVFDVLFSAVAFDIFTQAKAAAGIWVGAAILITGCIGLVTSRSELRRRTTILAFGGFSVASLLFSVVLIAISVSEMTTSSFVNGELIGQGNNCTFLNANATTLNKAVFLNETSPAVRCIAQTTFHQKLVTASLLFIFGFLESLTSVISIITTRDIFVNKYTNSKQQIARQINMSVIARSNDRLPNEEPDSAQLQTQEQ